MSQNSQSLAINWLYVIYYWDQNLTWNIGDLANLLASTLISFNAISCSMEAFTAGGET